MHLVIDIDDSALAAAAAALGTTSHAETINRALEEIAAQARSIPEPGVHRPSSHDPVELQDGDGRSAGERFVDAIRMLEDLSNPEVMKHAWRRQP